MLYFWNEAGDPNFYFISETSKSLAVRSRSLKKIYRVENFCVNVLKEGLKEKKFWNNTRQLNAHERAPQVSGQLFGICLPIFNFQQYQIFKISYFDKFHLSFEKNYLSPNVPKITKKFQKS